MLVGANKKYDTTINVSRTNAPLTLSSERSWLSATTISYNGVDYAIFTGGNNSFSRTIDIFYFNSSGTFSMLSTSVSLSVGRRWLKATTITYNCVDYAIFAGGENSSGDSNVIDVFYFNSSGTFRKLNTSVSLSVGRSCLAVTSISRNGVDYAIFGGG